MKLELPAPEAAVLRTLVLELRHACRSLASRPWFATAALLTIAVGIAANVTVFSIVNALLLKPLPFGDRTDRLVTIHPVHQSLAIEPGWGDAEISYRDLGDLREADSLEGMGGFLARNFVLSGDGADAERALGGSVTPDLFPLLGIEPFLGRHFRSNEAAAPGLESVVMLTHGLWQRRYGADPSIVGRTVVVNDLPRTVVGVLPPRFKFPERHELYVPLRWDDAPRSARNLNAVGLLRQGETIGEAREQLAAIARRLADTYPETNRDFGVQVVPIRRSYVGADEQRMGATLMASVGFVLLIVCANLANLMLVRGTSRQREFAVRAAMGANRARLLWAALSESVVLAGAGALLGVLAAQWALDLIVARIPEELPYWFDLVLDVNVVVFTAAAAAFTALAVGLLPGIRAARPNVTLDLKDGGRAGTLGPGGLRLQAVLSVAQIAMCFGLLVGANLMVRSFVAMQTADLGFDHRPLLTARAYLAGDAYDEVSARARFFDRVTTALASVPGVSAAAVTSAIPGDDGGSTARVVVDGRTAPEDEVFVGRIGISADLFRALGLPAITGRTFTQAESLDPAAAVALINESLAARLWPGESAVERRIGLRGPVETAWFRVVGVVPDVHYEEIGEATDQSKLNVYLPYGRDGSRSMALMLRSTGSAASLVAPIRDTLGAVAPGFPVYRLMPMSELRRFTTWEQEFFGDLMGLFALVALALACLGTYALTAYSVGRRSREFGVRLALGAHGRDLVRMLLRQAAGVGGAGLLAGLFLARGVATSLGSTLYGVQVDVTRGVTEPRAR
jgi:putative ABC transport system permease protein